MVTSIAFFMKTKTKEHTLHLTGIKFASLIFVKMDIGHTTKNLRFEMKGGGEQNMISKHG